MSNQSRQSIVDPPEMIFDIEMNRITNERHTIDLIRHRINQFEVSQIRPGSLDLELDQIHRLRLLEEVCRIDPSPGIRRVIESKTECLLASAETGGTLHRPKFAMHSRPNNLSGEDGTAEDFDLVCRF